MTTEGLLPVKYHSKEFVGVSDNVNTRSFSFWPTCFTGPWPEVWAPERRSGTLLNRQDIYKLLAQLATEAREMGITSASYPLGKNTHDVRLVHHDKGTVKNLVGVLLVLDRTNHQLAQCPSFKALTQIQDNVGLHLGYVPKHRDVVTAPVVAKIKEIGAGRVIQINRNFLYGGTPENRTRKAITMKVTLPYDGTDPFNNIKGRLSRRFNQIEEEDGGNSTQDYSRSNRLNIEEADPSSNP